jgi:hypothetical protein
VLSDSRYLERCCAVLAFMQIDLDLSDVAADMELLAETLLEVEEGWDDDGEEAVTSPHPPRHGRRW